MLGWVLAFLIGICGLCSYMIFLAFQNRLIRTELSFSNFPKTFEQITILFISDIHRREVSDKLLTQINEKIDLVIIGGDLMEKGVSLHRVHKNLKKLTAIGPTYFVWGNNDYEDCPQELDVLLSKCRITSLNNTAVLFESYEGEALTLLGVEDMGTNHAHLNWAYEKSMELAPDSFRILVSHNPDIVTEITEQQDISLVLSGHTHGGQIRLFGYGPYALGGVKKNGKTVTLISNGYGTTGIPMRLEAKSEVHVIKLIST